jgi:anthranilate synthase/aminodeoxychorismate synthase-like glutamine amidotransferase
MILMLDNYDSFTYNIVQYLGELGAELRIYRNDAVTIEQIRKLKPRGIVLSPGPGRPENAGIMNTVIREFAGTTSILGICLGHQGIGQVYGATITYAPTLMHGKVSQVEHNGSVLFNRVASPFTATRYHSLCIQPGTLSEEFTVTAWTSDAVIMGIQHKTLSLYGLQFHPESIMTSEGKTILSNFLENLI